MILLDVYNLIYRGAGVAGNKAPEDLLYNSIDKEILQLFFKMFNKLYRNFKKHKFVIAWEGDTNFREEIYPEYKKNREHHLRVDEHVFELIKRGLVYYGCKILRHKRAEGDDVIYNCCDIFRDEEELIVYSNDEDYIQLLQKFDNVKVYSPIKNKYVETPDYDYVKFKAIKGDTSDNIKGLEGYGPKKASMVLNNYSAFWGMLSEDHRNIIERNNVLIDMAQNPDNPSIKQYIEEELKDGFPEFSEAKIKEFYKVNKLKHLYMNFRSELNTFV